MSDWIYAGYYPMLVVSGSADIVAPLALSGNLYQSGSPSTVTLEVLSPAGHFATWENVTFIADAAARWISSMAPCERVVLGATRIDFASYPGSVGQMRGYRVDPASGPTSTVIAALPGGARPPTDLSEFALAMTARGVSVVQLAWPGTHSGYTVAQAGANSFSSSTQIALNYLQPVSEYLRTNGALRVFGFGWAMGNRFVRIASRVGGLFDGVIIAGAGHTFVGGLNSSSSTNEWVQYDVFQQNFFAPSHYGQTFVSNQMARALDECPAANTYIAPIIPHAAVSACTSAHARRSCLVCPRAAGGAHGG